MLYIYDLDLNLVGSGPKEFIENGPLFDMYIAQGYIVSTSKFDIIE